MTYLEKMRQDNPDMTDEIIYNFRCPTGRYGAPNFPTCEHNGGPTCYMCWNREMHETENTEKESNTMDVAITNITTKKTKAQLIEEIENKNGEIYALKQELDKFEKYRKYDEMGEELFAAKASLINAGFSDTEAFTLMLKMIEASARCL